MKVSKQWLDNFFDAPLPGAEAVAEALTFHAFEIDGIDTVGDDQVLDVKVTPNRGHDCLSHRGIAKEVSAILNTPLTKDPFKRPIDFSKNTNAVTVEIQKSELCKRYIAAYIKGVKVAPSPEWLRKSLEAVGQRSINNVVDATNLVMFNTGQPLHAFDAHKLGSLSIGVRLAQEGEVMQALDKKNYTLTSSMLVITAADAPVGIAGVKGGMPAAIDEATVDIVIESANFEGVSIRKTASALKLRTDASARFEQVISPELAAYGMQQAVDLISTIAGGEVQGFVDVYPEPQKEKRVSVVLAHVNRLLGTQLTGAEVADALVRLGLPYKEEHGTFEVIPPVERLDLEIAEDLIEEIARIVGYECIAGTPLPPFSGAVEINQNFAAAEAKREELVQQGYSEVYTSVFAEKGERIVLNKVDGVRPYMRDSLVPGLIDALRKNIPNKDLLGLKEIKLFEIGTVWKQGKEITMLGTAVGDAKSLTTKEGIVKEEVLAPASAATYEVLTVSTADRYTNFSKYPYIVRDIALWTPAGTSEEDVRATIQKEAGELAVRISLFDRFEKGEKLSLAFRVIFQSFERTLTEEEANTGMEKVSMALKVKGFEVR
jgi:phenylalanyl-tRNA synthetase beta chain